MITKVNGIILSTSDYSETSRILNVITKEYGIIGIMAKGCRSIKSNLRSMTDKLTYGEFNIYYKEDKLSTLISIDIIDSFKNIKKDIIKISYASYLLELSGQVIKQSNTNIYDILVNGLTKINEGYDTQVIMNIIELKYLDYLGVMPILDGCAKCGNKVVATLSNNCGGYVCNNCLTNEKIVNAKTIKMIRMYYYVDISKISKIEVENNVKNEINNFLDEYYDRYTGLYLKSKSFLKNLEKI